MAASSYFRQRHPPPCCGRPPQQLEHNHPPGELPPLVLLLHGYGEHWWTWHHQLQPIAAAGFHAMAVDLRGYGNSDKPPRGYDLVTAANDMAGLVRATGHRTVIVVGHGLGGAVGWTMARMFRKGVTKLIVVGAPHPLIQRVDLLKHRFHQQPHCWPPRQRPSSPPPRMADATTRLDRGLLRASCQRRLDKNHRRERNRAGFRRRPPHRQRGVLR